MTVKIENAKQAAEHPSYLIALTDWLYQLADDELTIGHRDSEWLGLCPDIEGDVAFSSIAQDEVGHAVFYFDLLHELGEADPDHLAFNRAVQERRNAILLERENGDWAYSIARHFFYDLFDHLRLESMLDSSYAPLARGAAKIRREEHYHLLHMQLWFTRLGQAGGVATQRLEQGIARIWPDLGGLFRQGVYEQELFKYQIITATTGEIRHRWLKQMEAAFLKADLGWPGEPPEPEQDGRRGEHSGHLTHLLSTMSEVYRLDPAARW